MCATATSAGAAPGRSRFAGARTREEAETELERIAARLPAYSDLTWQSDEDRVSVTFTTPITTRTRWGPGIAFCNHLVIQVRHRGPARLEDGSRIPERLVREVERLASRDSYRIGWRRGDIAVIDNSRVMHARGWALDPARRILARVSYAGF